VLLSRFVTDALVTPQIDGDVPTERIHQVLDARGKWNRKPINAFLVHEDRVAGIGNEYLTDILFRASLTPSNRCPRATSTSGGAFTGRSWRRSATPSREPANRDLHRKRAGCAPILDK
jgi:hypothetical protein